MVSPPADAPPLPRDPPFFERVLLPHRSLPPRGFQLLMLILGLISFSVGTAFVSIGAWPVTGFFGLDVALVYVAFRISYRRARLREILRLAGDAFTVERISVYGNRRVWRFQPFWLRVVLEERDADSNRLFVASHGRFLAIGDFLAPAVRNRAGTVRLTGALSWRRFRDPALP
jgi:uncharacterized membrane protein